MKSKISIFALVFAPLLASAQSAPFTKTVDGFLGYLTYLGSKIMPLLVLGALILFLFGIVKYFFFPSKDTPSSTDKRNFILWGIVALFVMVSVWGLVNVLGDTLQLNNRQVPPVPSVPFPDAPRAVPTAPSAGSLQ